MLVQYKLMIHVLECEHLLFIVQDMLKEDVKKITE